MRRVSDQQAAEMTVVENLQRQDLNCIEQAAAFSKLSRDFGLTQEQIGQRVGVSRESVSNYHAAAEAAACGAAAPAGRTPGIQRGAGAAAAASTPTLVEKVADEAVRKHMSVAQLGRAGGPDECPHGERRDPAPGTLGRSQVRAAQTEMERALGMRVRIRDRKGKGKIVIEYATLEDFDRVVEMLKGR